METQKPVENYMTPYPSVISPETKALTALKIMKKGHLRHLPVIEKSKVVGIVSERDLARFQPLLETSDPTVNEIMIRNPFVIPLGTPLSLVARTMAEHKYGSAIIVDNLSQVIGIFTTVDGMKLLSMLLDSENTEKTHEIKKSHVEEYLEEWSTESECLR